MIALITRGSLNLFAAFISAICVIKRGLRILAVYKYGSGIGAPILFSNSHF